MDGALSSGDVLLSNIRLLARAAAIGLLHKYIGMPYRVSVSTVMSS